MNEIGAKCGHVKRRLVRSEPLTGKVLQFALEIIGADGANTPDDEFLKGIGTKLRSGTPLDEYELHIMVDVILLHTCLGAAGHSLQRGRSNGVAPRRSP